MTKVTLLEPGLITVFRTLVTARWVLHLVSFVIALLVDPEALFLSGAFAFYFSLFEITLPLVYLWWPGLEKRLGRAYLPLGLTVTTIGPLAATYLQLAALNTPQPFATTSAWGMLLVLMIPLVLIAWQYSFRGVVIFTLGTIVLEVGSKLQFIPFDPVSDHRLWGVIVLRMVLFLLVGYMISRLVTAQRTWRWELALANAKLTNYTVTLEQLTISRERNRLARELHDTLAHTLSGAAVQLEAVDALWESNPETAHAVLRQSLGVIRSGLTETRRALQDLRASPLADLGLRLALRTLVESMAQRLELALELRLTNELDNLDTVAEQCIYRVAQETLTNIDRHASAGRMTVQLDWLDETRLCLSIVDDGCGFDPVSLVSDERLGLQGMRERAEMVGGDLDVDSKPGQGTTIRLIVPARHNGRQL